MYVLIAAKKERRVEAEGVGPVVAAAPAH
jgi:hypothetical protein